MKLVDLGTAVTLIACLQAKKEKLFMILWCPDDAKVKKKMLYSSSFEALKKALVGIGKYIQVRSRL